MLVYAHRADTAQNLEMRAWLEAQINADAAYGLCDLVVSGFLRVVTHPRVFEVPSSWADAIRFAEQLREQPNCVSLGAGPHHWEIFTRLCKVANAKGNLIGDAYLAAIAIEHGCEWITTDHDFRRFPGLKWRHPLQ